MRALALMLALAGCGYRADRDMSRERDAAGRLPTVAIDPFDNDTFRRGLETRLTRLLSDEVRARSPRAPSAASSADWILKGTIRRAEERVLSEDTKDRVRESSFVITVAVTLTERSTQKTLKTDSFTIRESFSARAGRIATLEQAQEEALRDIAENIIYWLEAQNPKESS